MQGFIRSFFVIAGAFYLLGTMFLGPVLALSGFEVLTPDVKILIDAIHVQTQAVEKIHQKEEVCKEEDEKLFQLLAEEYSKVDKNKQDFSKEEWDLLRLLLQASPFILGEQDQKNLQNQEQNAWVYYQGVIELVNESNPKLFQKACETFPPATMSEKILYALLKGMSLYSMQDVAKRLGSPWWGAFQEETLNQKLHECLMEAMEEVGIEGSYKDICERHMQDILWRKNLLDDQRINLRYRTPQSRIAFARYLRSFSTPDMIDLNETSFDERDALSSFLFEIEPGDRDAFRNYFRDFLRMNFSDGEKVRIVEDLFRIPRENWEAFSKFCRENNVRGDELEDLSHVPNPQDWGATLVGLRQRNGNQAVAAQGVRLQNQSVHDEEFESSVKRSFEALQKRYGSLSESFESLMKQFSGRLESLQKQQLLTPVELRVISKFFDGTRDLTLHEKNTITLYLNLVWQSLNDEKAAAEVLGRNPTQKDMDERFASWFRSGPMDAQLAYILDNLGGGQFKDKKVLLEALDKNFDAIAGAGKSCLGGSYNRLISGLDRMHPDVTLQYGRAAKINTELYALRNNLKKQGHLVLQQLKNNMSDEMIRKSAREQLQKFLASSSGEYPNLNAYQQEATFRAYFDADFEKDLLAARGLRDVMNYIEQGGMRDDILQVISQHPNPFAMDALKKIAQNLVNERLSAKFKALGNKGDGAEQKELFDIGQGYVGGIVEGYQKDILRAIIQRKSNELVGLPAEVVNKENYDQKDARKEKISQFLRQGVMTILQEKNFVTDENIGKLRELMGDVIKEDTIYDALNFKGLKPDQVVGEEFDFEEAAKRQKAREEILARMAQQRDKHGTKRDVESYEGYEEGKPAKKQRVDHSQNNHSDTPMGIGGGEQDAALRAQREEARKKEMAMPFSQRERILVPVEGMDEGNEKESKAKAVAPPPVIPTPQQNFPGTAALPKQ